MCPRLRFSASVAQPKKVYRTTDCVAMRVKDWSSVAFRRPTAKGSLHRTAVFRQTPRCGTEGEKACLPRALDLRDTMSRRREEKIPVRLADVLPALAMYGVADLEATYSIGLEASIQAIQLRDVSGNRIARHVLPVNLLDRLEEMLCALIQSSDPKRSERDGKLEISVERQAITYA
jgi:hypothetical protein